LANLLAREVEKLLSGVLGEFIAMATVKKNCELIGTTPDAITSDHLPELAEKIERSIAFFTDKETGRSLAEKVKSVRV
jgi:hypothetical protein